MYMMVIKCQFHACLDGYYIRSGWFEHIIKVTGVVLLALHIDRLVHGEHIHQPLKQTRTNLSIQIIRNPLLMCIVYLHIHYISPKGQMFSETQAITCSFYILKQFTKISYSKNQIQVIKMVPLHLRGHRTGSLLVTRKQKSLELLLYL